MAKHKKFEEEKRKHRVTLNFTDKEWERISDRINNLEAKPSEYMRSLITRGYYRKIKYPRVSSQVMAQLSRTCGLLKDFYNRSGKVNADLTADVIGEIREVVLLIRKEIENVDRQTDTELEYPL
jgi:hypothetical protein